MSGYIQTGKKNWLPKDPDALLDYSWKWSNWLAASNPADTISSYDVVLTGSVDAVLESQSHSNGVVTAWISGGLPGEELALTCSIVTSSGRRDDRTVYLKVEER